ncbi:MAG TPA: hypothetical protein PKW33_02225 [Anaerolineaceae bacterium]|nr:hypothetical protein [Anaerolineaceae bacterium]HPN50377.1 hypothetical protein [Anaerolineaceae bacterium]
MKKSLIHRLLAPALSLVLLALLAVPALAQPSPDPSGGGGAPDDRRGLSYVMISGATLQPRQESAKKVYLSAGCAYLDATSETTVLNDELHLPEGSVIKFLRVYYFDNVATASIFASITTYEPTLAAIDLTYVESASASVGFGYNISPEITATVQNGDNAYTVLAWPQHPVMNLRICGVRVAYYPPPKVFLPEVLKNLTGTP